MSRGLLNHLDALENTSHYPPPELKPVGRGQPTSLSASQEEHLSNQPASPLLSPLIKITNQGRKLHCEAADRANFKTNYCTRREAVWPERPAQVRRYAQRLTEQTWEREHITSKTHDKAILLMQLCQNSNNAEHPFGVIFNPQRWCKNHGLFSVWTQQIAIRVTAQTSSMCRLRTDLKG